MYHRLEIRQLQMIVSVVTRNGISSAASELGLTPSALSHRLREAERRLGLALFDSDRRNLQLTPAGESVYRAALKILAELNQAEKTAIEIANGYDNTLRIGSRAYACYRWLPAFLAEFREAQPRTIVEIHDDSACRPLEALHDGVINVAIISGPVKARDAEVKPLFRDQLMGVLPPGRAPSAHWLEAEDFVNEPYVTYGTDPEPGHEYEQFFAKASLVPRQIIVAGMTEAIIELVHYNFGFSILAGWAVRTTSQSGYVESRPLTRDGVYLQWSAAIRSDEPESSAARTLVDALANWCIRRQDLIGYNSD